MSTEPDASRAATRGQLIAVMAWCLLAAFGPVLTLAAASYGSSVPFVVAMILQVAALVWVGRIAWSWRDPPRGARAMDFVLGAVVLVTGAVALVLVREVAQSFGIRGSALPRVRSGIADPVDFAYLGATGVVVTLMGAAVVLLLLMARSTASVRAVSQSAGESSGEAIDAVEALLAVPAQPRQTLAVTSARDPFLRRLMGRSAWILFGVCAALSVPGLWLVAADYEGSLELVGGVVLYIGVPVTAWAVLQSVWRRDEDFGVAVPALLRSMVVPVVTALPIGLLQLLLVHLPVFADRVRSYQRPDEVYEGHYWFPLEDESLFTALALDLTLGGVAMAGVAGLVVAVFLVLPITSFRDPDQLMREQGMSGSREHRARNVAAARVLALGLPLAFVVPALLVGTDPGDTRRWIAIALAVVGVGALYYVWRNQRVDLAARASGRMPMGVLNPDDRRRLDDATDASGSGSGPATPT
ncbi:MULTISPECIES: hypothetical protein [unclassified Knoellia]|uniref:hypothetical protein n=1 Tax=Knoellia altitudinis TaxID=3404795 RepID=UPI003607D2A6